MRVLCVDDDPNWLASMVERLEADHFVVEAAATAKAALDAFRKSPFQYDVVVTDLALSAGEAGEKLAESLIELREGRGYDPAPEIICITGDQQKMQSILVNSLRDRGCQYALKGSEQYVVETHAAIERLNQRRNNGPLFLIVHQGSESYQWGENRNTLCVPGEIIKDVYFVHSGGRELIEMAPAPRRIFDFLARHTSRRSFSLNEVANSITLSEFYTFWQKSDSVDTKESVKNNILRIRNALKRLFEGMGSHFSPDMVLATEWYEDISEYSGSRSSMIRPSRIRVAAPSATEAYSEKDERYRLNARVVVEHLPNP